MSRNAHDLSLDAGPVLASNANRPFIKSSKHLLPISDNEF